MAVVLGNGTISGLNVGGLPNETVVRTDIQTTAKRVQFEGVDNTQGYALVTGIRDSNTTYTRTFDLSNIGYTTYSDTVAVMVKRYYLHNGGTNHGYFSSRIYQVGNSTHYVTDSNSHYDWYFNSDDDVFLVPWDPSLSDSIVIDCVASYNNSSSNYYDYYVVGQVRGARK